MDELSLCDSVVKEMMALGFNQNSINYVTSSKLFIGAKAESDVKQRSMLTLALYNVLINSEEIVPSRIRLALNVAGDTTCWLDDIKLVILPFLRVNEEKFFK